MCRLLRLGDWRLLWLDVSFGSVTGRIQVFVGVVGVSDVCHRRGVSGPQTCLLDASCDLLQLHVHTALSFDGLSEATTRPRVVVPVLLDQLELLES